MVLNIRCVTYFVTSITMPNLGSSNNSLIRWMMSALPLASHLHSKLWIPFLNHLLDGDICNKILWFQYFVFFMFSITILSYTSMLPVSQLQILKPVTEQIWSHIENWIQSHDIPVLILYSQLILKNLGSLTVFNTI